MAATPNPIKTHAAHIKPATEAPKPRPRSKSAYPPLPQDPQAYCRLPQILEFLGIGKSRYYTLMSECKMPKPIKIGRSSMWSVFKIREAAKKLMNEGEK